MGGLGRNIYVYIHTYRQVQEAKTLLGQAALNQLSAEQLRNARLGDLTKLFERP
jgi:hypothetical protein